MRQLTFRSSFFYRFTVLSLLFFILIQVCSVQAFASGKDGSAPPVDARSVFIMEARTGSVVYAKNPQELISTDTILPLLISMAVLDEKDPDEYILITGEAQLMSTKITNGTGEVGLKAGERLSIRQLLSSVLLANSQDACRALSEVFDQDSELLARIQAKISQLGLSSTLITSYLITPDSEDHTTVMDTAKVMQAFLTYPFLAELNRMPSYSFTPNNMVPESREIKNIHLQLTRGTEGSAPELSGFLAGISSAAPEQTSFVAATEKDSGVFIAALEGPIVPDASTSADKLFDWAAGEVKTVRLVTRGEAISHLELSGGETLDLTADSDVYYLASAVAPKPSFTVSFRPETASGEAIEQNQRLGSAEILVGNEPIATVSLLAARPVSAAEIQIDSVSAQKSGMHWFLRIIIGLLLAGLFVLIIRTFNLLRRSKKRQSELRRARQAILEQKKEDARLRAYGIRSDDLQQ